jgi:hypothetical protein
VTEGIARSFLQRIKAEREMPDRLTQLDRAVTRLRTFVAEQRTARFDRVNEQPNFHPIEGWLAKSDDTVRFVEKCTAEEFNAMMQGLESMASLETLGVRA